MYHGGASRLETAAAWKVVERNSLAGSTPAPSANPTVDDRHRECRDNRSNVIQSGRRKMKVSDEGKSLTKPMEPMQHAKHKAPRWRNKSIQVTKTGC